MITSQPGRFSYPIPREFIKIFNLAKNYQQIISKRETLVVRYKKLNNWTDLNQIKCGGDFNLINNATHPGTALTVTGNLVEIT